MSNDLTVLNELFTGENALYQQSEEELRQLDRMSSASSFLQRLQLYAKGKSGAKGTIIEAGHYGVPKSGDEILDLGDTIDVYPLFRKPKAIDMSDTDNIIVSNTPGSKEFARIEDMADNVKDSGCAYGPAYLVYERSTATFYEFFCGNKSGRREASEINKYLPVTPQMIDLGTTQEKEPRFARPMTLTSEFAKKGKWEWFAPKAQECLTPFDLPSIDQIKFEIERFRKLEDAEVEVVEEGQTSKRKR
jgi:hypothetical protein